MKKVLDKEFVRKSYAWDKEMSPEQKFMADVLIHAKENGITRIALRYDRQVDDIVVMLRDGIDACGPPISVFPKLCRDLEGMIDTVILDRKLLGDDLTFGRWELNTLRSGVEYLLTRVPENQNETENKEGDQGSP